MRMRMRMFHSDHSRMIEKRPFREEYETPEQRAIENEVKRYIEKTSNVICRKLPKRDVLDFALCVEEQIVGFCEVRSRSCPWSTIEEGGFYLPFKKHLRIRSLHQANGIPTALVVVCRDKTMRLWMGKHDDLEVIWWGDTRTDETHDREPMVVVPAFFFTHLYDRKS